MPNWHVVLIHVPLGLLMVGVLIEVFSFLWPGGSFRTAGRWMILLGALGMIPAMTSGVYSFSEVVRVGNSGSTEEMTWRQIVQGSALQGRAVQWEMLRRHIWAEGGGAVLCILGSVVFLGCSDEGRRKLRGTLLVVVLFGVGLMCIGAWYGGEMVFREGMSVVAGPRTAATSQPLQGVEQGSSQILGQIEYFAPLVQLHVVLAGMMIAVALGAMGLSLRNGVEAAEAEKQAELTGPFMVSSSGNAPSTESLYLAAMAGKPVEAGARGRGGIAIPAGRFWVLGALLAIVTGIGGILVAGADSSSWSLGMIWSLVSNRGLPRRFLHVVAGCCIILLSIIAGAVSRWGPRRRSLLGFLSLLLIVAAGIQVWLGILLLLDSDDGPVAGFNLAVSGG
jgi:uncharacterized membrane protein